MEKERRRQIPQLNNLHKRLNTDQLLTLVLVEEFGWRMEFVRLPLNQNPIHVVYNDIVQCYGILKEDGSLKIAPDLKKRNETPSSLH